MSTRVGPPAASVPPARGLRESSIELLRSADRPPRGVGLAGTGADGELPPSAHGAVSTSQRTVDRTTQRPSAVASNPGAAAAASPHPGRHVDMRA